MNLMDSCRLPNRVMMLTFLALALSASIECFAQTPVNCPLPGSSRIYGLSSDNSLYLYVFGQSSESSTGRFTRLGKVRNIDGTLIGIDARPSEGVPDTIYSTGGVIANSLYGVTSTGKVYRISLNPLNLTSPVLISTVTQGYAAGLQGLADFNPIGARSPLRLIGSNDQNYALVDGAGTLDTTVKQAATTYATDDVNAGVDPNLTAGAYDNSLPGAAVTTFYGVDYTLGTLVTIADRNAAGSSNTAGGVLRTIGQILDGGGRRLAIQPAAGLDIYSQNGPEGLKNTAIMVNGDIIYCAALPQNPTLGTPVNFFSLSPLADSRGPADPQLVSEIVSGDLIDVAVTGPYNPSNLKISGSLPNTLFGQTACAGSPVSIQYPNGALGTNFTANDGSFTFQTAEPGVYTIFIGYPAQPSGPINFDFNEPTSYQRVVLNGASVAGLILKPFSCPVR
jgi:hypothetical protein